MTWSYGKRLLDAALAAAGAKLEPWTLHDLRRSVATGMAECLGVAPHVVEAVLNHVSGHKAGVAGIYNLATYEKEQRAALVMWADHVLAAIEGALRPWCQCGLDLARVFPDMRQVAVVQPRRVEKLTLQLGTDPMLRWGIGPFSLRRGR